MVAQMVKNLPAIQETWVRSLGWKDPLKKGMATRSSILAWKIPWMDEPGRLQSMGPIQGSNPRLLHLPHWLADSVPLRQLRSIQVPHLLYPFQWTFRLLPCPGYGKSSQNEHLGVCILVNYSFLWIYGLERDF